ncbi:AIPR family protein [Falcatimonas sp. MSJ-15]|uniref:AIPR family protein n=1 Tax=Falcatimonas sp. MSJ-15 TaxID=2841515 RepID=UPI001C0F7B84|nr:AIPR family protein [Falcatimonas sp. MSJ-15]MBU5470556.1 AIPR family protein [Falcatimonas sp. MSJ-15]
MEVNEYRTMLQTEIDIAAETGMSNPEEEFLKKITDILKDGEEFDDFTECFYEGETKHKAKMRIDGYAMDEIDGSCSVFITDYRGIYEDDSVRTDEINSMFRKIRYFVEEAIKYKIYDDMEESSEVYEFAQILHNEIDNISKFRFYFITDAYNRQRVKNIKDDVIAGKNVELNVWDINRIFNVVTSTMQKESVEIYLSEFGMEGIPCVKGMECNNVLADIEILPLYNEDDEKTDKNNKITYSSYLASVPGQILCDLYLEYGSRLLEGNVRSFLSVKGKVNKSIQNTIKNYPDMFFAYNNGIAATATEIDTKMTENGLVITRIKDLQIVNGGQTTASIANAVLTAKKGEKVKLDNLRVPMKISILEYYVSEKIIPKISEYSNSQNKVDASDFFSNHPFHIRMEDYSRKTPAPAVNGNQYQQYWYYERTRGQYNQGKMKLTVGEVNQYKLRYPENQVIKMVELAKYMEIYAGAPDKVSKGKQAIVKAFAEKIKVQWMKSDEEFDVYYFKRVVAIAIIYKNADRIIKNSDDYRNGERNSYKANVIAYMMSIIFEYVQKNEKGRSIDFMRIWSTQNIYPELEKQIRVLWPEVYDFITSVDRSTQNVTEWCKKKECWERAKKRRWTILSEFLDSLSDAKNRKKDVVSNKNLENEIDNLKMIIGAGASYWRKVLEWGDTRNLLYDVEKEALKSIIALYTTGVMPSERQQREILRAREKLIREGMRI